MSLEGAKAHFSSRTIKKEGDTIMVSNEKIFEYEALSKKFNIEPETLKKIVDEARREFEQDEMMVELHVVRALRCIKNKSVQGVLA